MEQPDRGLTVEVAYATPIQQRIVVVTVPVSATIEQAIHASGILVLFPEIDLATQQVGIFSKPRQLTDVVAEGDRVEIYRPLTIDPKDLRRARAKQAAKR